jgi:hypothetical protein
LSLSINAGVPQGSVLGPLLFLIYVNDIAESLESTARLFADDSSLAVTSTNINTIQDVLNSDLQKNSSWSQQWLVILNPLKTEVVTFSLVNCEQPKLIFNNNTLTLVQDHKYLGVSLSNNGSWHEHITTLLPLLQKS